MGVCVYLCVYFSLLIFSSRLYLHLCLYLQPAAIVGVVRVGNWEDQAAYPTLPR